MGQGKEDEMCILDGPPASHGVDGEARLGTGRVTKRGPGGRGQGWQVGSENGVSQCHPICLR